MEIIQERVRRRRDTFFFYRTHLSKYKGINFLEEPDKSYFSNHWLTTILVDPEKTGVTRELLQLELVKENIESPRAHSPSLATG
jgi:dTDP-4-amino-4,6-dideoxygalactose transaminase